MCQASSNIACTVFSESHPISITPLGNWYLSFSICDIWYLSNTSRILHLRRSGISFLLCFHLKCLSTAKSRLYPMSSAGLTLRILDSAVDRSAMNKFNDLSTLLCRLVTTSFLGLFHAPIHVVALITYSRTIFLLVRPFFVAPGSFFKNLVTTLIFLGSC